MYCIYSLNLWFATFSFVSLIVTSKDKNIYLCDLNTGSKMHTIKGTWYHILVSFFFYISVFKGFWFYLLLKGIHTIWCTAWYFANFRWTSRGRSSVSSNWGIPIIYFVCWNVYVTADTMYRQETFACNHNHLQISASYSVFELKNSTGNKRNIGLGLG